MLCLSIGELGYEKNTNLNTLTQSPTETQFRMNSNDAAWWQRHLWCVDTTTPHPHNLHEDHAKVKLVLPGTQFIVAFIGAITDEHRNFACFLYARRRISSSATFPRSSPVRLCCVYLRVPFGRPVFTVTLTKSATAKWPLTS